METDELLTGTWYVVLTSLPFWRSRSDPSVTYAELPDGRIVDTVRYTRKGMPHLVHGVDMPLPGGDFLWRGVTPLTRLTSSRWRVLASGDGWAVTHFDKTLFTPAGWDVYAREPWLEAELEAAARAALDVVPDLPALFAPNHSEAHPAG